jgi:hypothetical protein
MITAAGSYTVQVKDFCSSPFSGGTVVRRATVSWSNFMLEAECITHIKKSLYSLETKGVVPSMVIGNIVCWSISSP